MHLTCFRLNWRYDSHRRSYDSACRQREEFQARARNHPIAPALMLQGQEDDPRAPALTIARRRVESECPVVLSAVGLPILQACRAIVRLCQGKSLRENRN